MDKNSKWMTISGIVGFSFFLVANFTRLFVGLNVFAAFLQIGVNILVFVVWKKAFLQSYGLKKFIAFFGVIVPIFMATITIWRVLLPTFIK